MIFMVLVGVSILGRMPIIEPSPFRASRMVDALAPDVIAADSGNDHGWWYFEMDSASPRDPVELCRAILHEMAAQGEWGWPGIGIELARFDVNAEGRRIWSSKMAFQCGRPDLLGRDVMGK